MGCSSTKYYTLPQGVPTAYLQLEASKAIGAKEVSLTLSEPCSGNYEGQQLIPPPAEVYEARKKNNLKYYEIAAETPLNLDYRAVGFLSTCYVSADVTLEKGKKYTLHISFASLHRAICKMNLVEDEKNIPVPLYRPRPTVC